MISGQFRGDQNIGVLAEDDLVWSQVPVDDDSLHVAKKPGCLIPIFSGSFTNGYLWLFVVFKYQHLLIIHIIYICIIYIYIN
jgi:hypothetical protein